jgi:hypothetical protein
VQHLKPIVLRRNDVIAVLARRVFVEKLSAANKEYNKYVNNIKNAEWLLPNQGSNQSLIGGSTHWLISMKEWPHVNFSKSAAAASGSPVGGKKPRC